MAGRIDIDTTEMATSAKKLKEKASEMQSAVDAANTGFAPCTTMTSKRVKRRVEEWETIYKKFKDTLEQMVLASDNLLKAAQRFEATDDEE